MRLFKILLLTLIFSSILFPQDKINLVTYGSEANIVEGDNDFVQYIFVEILQENLDSLLYIRGFDLDCGGTNDLPYGPFNTTTEYTLYGGSGLRGAFNNRDEANSTLQIPASYIMETKSFSASDEYDNRWKVLFELKGNDLVNPDGSMFFIVKVAGKSGDDANIFNIDVSKSSFDEFKPENVKVFTYIPTLRLTADKLFASIKFDIPRTEKLIIHEFDAGKAEVKFNSPFRSVPLVNVSNQGKWSEHTINLESIEYNKKGELYFGQGPEQPNDVTFYFTTEKGEFVPVFLPIEEGKANKRPVIKYSIVKIADCYSAVFDAENSFDPDGDQLTYEWFFGDGKTAKGSRVRHRYDEQKTFQAILVVSDNSGTIANSSYEVFNVTINVPPVAAAGADQTTAPGDVVSFDAGASTDADGNIIKYYWEFGDGATAEGKTVTHKYAAPGKFNVRLVVTDNSDSPCNNNSDDMLVTVNAAPVAVIIQTANAAIDEELTFDAKRSYDPDGELVDYEWDFADGTVLKGEKVTHAFSAAGTYGVKLTVTDNSGVSNSTDFTTVPVLINNPPIAEAGNDRLIAVDEIVILEGKGSQDADGRIIDYSWDMGDGTKKSGYSVAHSYAMPGKYKVLLKVKDDSGTKLNENNDSLVVTVNARPIAEAGDDIASTFGRIKFNGGVSSDSDGDIVKYEWDFGDGNTGNGVDPTHIYSDPGTYRVRLEVTDNTNTKNNSNEDFLTVVINQRPVADAGPDILSAPGRELKFNGTNSFDPDGRLTSYEWYFEDGEKLNGPEVKKTFNKPGIYNVNLKVKDNSGDAIAVDYDNLTVVINSNPKALAGGNKILAPGQSSTFEASSSFDYDGQITAYQWEFSDGESYDEKSFSRDFDEPGIYYAYLKVSDDANTVNSSDNDTIMIFVNSKPIARLPEDIFTCSRTIYLNAGNSADADGDAMIYTWDFGDGTTVTNGEQVKHTYEKGGTYPVKLTVDDGRSLNNSVSTGIMTVKINLPPVADAGADLVTCAGETILFDASASTDPEGGVMKYKWDFGDGSSAEELNPAKVFPKGGIYQVTLSVTDDSDLECNVDTDHIVVKVVESPVANAGPDMVVCANTEVKFDGTASTDFDGVVNNYEWFFGDGGLGGGATPTYIYKKAGTYNVTLTVTGDLNEGCSNSDSDELVVTVIEAPVAEFEALTIAPVNTPVEFDAGQSVSDGSNITKYTWDFGDGATAEGEEVTHTYTRYGKYIVSLIISTDSETECNSAIVQKMITINGAPIADAGDDKKAQPESAVVFNAGNSKDPDGAIRDYRWDTGDGNVLEGVQVYHSYSDAGSYEVVLTVTDNTEMSNNTTYDTVNVVINSLPEAAISSPDIVCIDVENTYEASGTSDTDGQILEYLWNFGDGTTLTGKSVKHKFNSAGKYSVALEINDNSGLANNAVYITKQIIVNTAPVIKTKSMIVTAPGEGFVLDASNSYDPDGNMLSVSWEISDDNVLTGAKTSSSYDEPGKYNILLQLDDNAGSPCSIVSREVEVYVNYAPVAVFKPLEDKEFGIANNYFVLDATESSDQDKDALTFTWKINGEVTLSGESIIFNYDSPGRYTIGLTVDDGKGLSNSKTTTSQTITVAGK